MEAAEQVRKFEEFFDSHYRAELSEQIRKGNDYLPVDFSLLSQFDPDLANTLLEDPENVLKAGEIAAASFSTGRKISNFSLRLFSLPNSQIIMIRDIRSKHIGKLLTLIGLVRQKTDVRPQVTSTRFECPSCGNIIPILQLDSKFREPTSCGCGRKGKFRLLSKELVDAQGIVMEEVTDQLDGGEQPKRINILLKKDLVAPLTDKKTNPGTKIGIVGILKEIPVLAKDGGKLTKFDLLVEANNVQTMEEGFQDLSIS
ncbi:MAG TPA: hypothetical protein VKE88_02935, partial [Candidatus Nanoarchaeia archaeon]|nr:hypothetical protein [Candidatus Nanoarchaeia archaeon]